MEVLNDRVSMLTNYEVLELLKETEKDTKQMEKQLRTKSLKIVTKVAIDYLRETPAAKQTTESIGQVITKLKPFKLTAAETLQIVNLRPASATEIQLIVEESEERFKTEERINNLVEVITSTLPAKK